MRSRSFSNASVSARILLVDDNNFGVVARKSLLEENGCQVTTASDGLQGLETFKRGAFDLLITDYRMPRMNGLELIQEVRELSKDVRIILISGYAEALGMTAESTGADAVIAKSSNEVAQLLRTVNRLCCSGTPKKTAASQKRRPRIIRQAGG